MQVLEHADSTPDFFIIDEPENHKQRTHNETKDPNRPVLSFLVNLHKTINESSEPEQPFETCHQHKHANDTGIDDLTNTLVSMVTTLSNGV